MLSKLICCVLFSILLTSILIVANTIPAKSQNTITVPDDFSTIQEAINNANAGDTIFVRNGTYSGPIVINKSLTLESENRDSTVIDGGTNEPSGSIVFVAADNVKISGFTIQHCRSGGNAVWLDSYVNMTFTNNTIIGNNEGVRILRSSGNIVSHNIIQDCYYNTAIGLNWAYNNVIYSNIIKNCNVGIGGNHWNNTFFENIIEGCKGGWAGWGISDNFSDCIFFHNNLIDNEDQVYNMNPSLNVWDNGCEGNYWSDYNGTDSDGDGIGNASYVIDGFNQDGCPLMSPYMSGDINHDAIVDIFDIARIAGIFGCSSADPQWNPHCDVNEDNVIDIFDLVTVAVNFGKEWTPP